MQYKELKVSLSHMFITGEDNLRGNIEFSSNMGHTMKINLTEQEANTMKQLVEDLKQRAFKEIPAMITEVQIQERVNVVVNERMAEIENQQDIGF